MQFRDVLRNENGGIVPSADVEIRDASGSLVTIYSDVDLTTTISQPFQSTIDGVVEFFAPSGEYVISATAGTDSVEKTIILPFVTGGAQSIVVDDLSEFEGSTRIVYAYGDAPDADGEPFVVSEGDFIHLRASDSYLQVAASGASDQHYSTSNATPVKAYEAGPNFSTRARLVAAHDRLVAASQTLPEGTVWTAGNYSVERASGDTSISDLPDWRVRQRVIYVDTISDLTALDTGELPSGQQVNVYEYAAGTARGGGLFFWDESNTDTDDSGKVFAADAGGTGRWLRDAPPSVFQVDWYGATGDGTTSDVSAIQDAADAAIATGNGWSLIFPDWGTWVIDDEIDLTADTAEEQCYLGGVTGKARLLISPMGAAKKVFSWADDAKMRCEVARFHLASSGLAADKKDWPIFLWAPETSVGASLHDIVSQGGKGGGFCIFFASDEVFNVDVNDVNLFNGGWQPLEKEVSDTARVTTSGTTVTSNESIFAAGDVGKWLYIEGAGDSDVLANGFAAKIDSFTSGTEVELDTAVINDVTSEYVSFGQLRADVSGTTVSCTGAHGLEASDVGRLVFIDKAESDDRVMAFEVASITDTTTFELNRSATQSVTNSPLWFSAVFAVGRTLQGSVSPATGERVNDLKFSNVLIENHQGLGLACLQGVNMFFDHFKVHGDTRNKANFATTGTHMVLSDCRGIMGSIFQLSHSNPGDEGIICQRGGNLSFTDMNIVRTCCNTPILSVGVDDEDSWLHLGYGRLGSRFANMAALDLYDISGNLSDNMVLARVKTSAPFIDLDSNGTYAAFHHPITSAGFNSGAVDLGAGEVFSIVPPRGHGFLSAVQDQSVAAHAFLRFRTEFSPSSRTVEVGASAEVLDAQDLTGTSGTADLSVAVNQDQIQLQNNDSTSRVISYTFIV